MIFWQSWSEEWYIGQAESFFIMFFNLLFKQHRRREIAFARFSSRVIAVNCSDMEDSYVFRRNQAGK
jgi:hypothetical protein